MRNLFSTMLALCRVHTGRCEDMADFVVLWRHHDDQWHDPGHSTTTTAQSMPRLDAGASQQSPRAVT